MPGVPTAAQADGVRRISSNPSNEIAPAQFFARVAEIEDELGSLLAKADELYAAKTHILGSGAGTTDTEAVKAFDLSGLRRAIAAGQAIALSGPDDAMSEARLALGLAVAASAK